jgi:hypothetical protein
VAYPPPSRQGTKYRRPLLGEEAWTMDPDYVSGQADVKSFTVTPDSSLGLREPIINPLSLLPQRRSL